MTATESGVGPSAAPARPGPAQPPLSAEPARPGRAEPRPRLDVMAAALMPDRMRQLSPRWVAGLFVAGALVLVPWIIYLGFELPEQNVELTAAALVGGCGEALVGPLSPVAASRPQSQEMLAALRLFVRRAVGASGCSE